MPVMMAMWAWPHEARAQKRAGAEERVDLKASGRDVTINFRYCPRGEVEPGDPDERTGTKVALGPFLLSETEVSQRDFLAIAGKEIYEKVQRRAQDARLGEYFTEKNITLPIFSLTLGEAIEFCRRLEELTEKVANTSIVRRRFRLPSHLEWQYACRAWPDPDNPRKEQYSHFNGWRNDVWLNDKELQKWCNEDWKLLTDSKKAEGDFRGDQQQVVAIVKVLENKTNDRPLEILRRFLKAGIDWEPCLDVVPEPTPHPVKSNKVPNSWKMWDMHGNAAEFTLHVENQRNPSDFSGYQEKVRDLWKLAKKPERTEQENNRLKNDLKIILAGGRYSLLIKDGRWKHLTIWGGEPKTLSEAMNGNEMTLFGTGIRVLMETDLSDNWLSVIRNTAGINGQPPPNAVEELIKHQNIIKDLLIPDRAEVANAQVDVYKAYAYYKLGKKSDAVKVLRQAREKLKDDPYLVSLELLMEADSLDGK